MKKEPILMMYVGFATFVKRDIVLLKSAFTVHTYHFNTVNKRLLPWALLKQFSFLLFSGYQYKSIVIQSAGYVSFLPVLFGKLFKKPIIVVAIGTDCAKIPEINYGAHSKPILAWFTRFSFKNASLILPVHKSLTQSKYTYTSIKFPKQGIKSFVKNIHTPILEMVNGYDTKKWKITDTKKIENSFLTVTFALDKIGYYRKGIDLIIAMAKLFPTHTFTIVGQVKLQEKCPKNIVLIHNVSQKKLVTIYNKHQYYLQLSMFEGFPNALCEAMLCGCIPIGSNVAGIPDIIDKNGYILKKKDTQLLKKLIENLSKNTISPTDVRSQISTNFPFKRRKKEFIDHLKNIIS